MTTYEWPAGGHRPELADDARGRHAFLGPLRISLPFEAGEAPAPHHPAGLAAPANDRENLWVPLGPASVIHGQAVGTPRIAGRVNGLAISDDGQRVYAAAANGGVWFSADAGGTWRSVGGLASTIVGEINRPATRNAVGAIAMRSGASVAADEVFVGTGEPYYFPDNITAHTGAGRGGVGILVGAGAAATPNSPNPWRREAPNLVGEAVNRIAVQPGGPGVVAATTKGLFRRPDIPAANLPWVRVDQAPFDDEENICTDVLWTQRVAGGPPERLWVWLQAGPNAGLWVRDGAADEFRKVATTGFLPNRAALAASNPPIQVWLLNNQGPDIAPLLFRIDSVNTARPTATPVGGVPNVLGKQGFYDLAIAVDPAHPGRVYLGGCTFAATAPDGVPLENSRDVDDAAVVWADVATNGAGQLTFGHPNPPAGIGVGVHADVHAVQFSNAGARLWVCCDGGVFRSDSPTAPVGFYPVNTGLSVIESNYLAAHPACEGFMVAGLQDNGVIKRRSETVWENAGLGDGGGITLDPLHSLPEDQWFRQYFNGEWEGSVTHAYSSLYKRWVPGVGANPGSWVAHDNERDAAAFYSTPAAIAHRRGNPAPDRPNVAQLIVGTDRVWYSEDFGVNWRLLPSGLDGLTPENRALDTCTHSVRVCRWQNPDVAWVLTDYRVYRYARIPASDNGVAVGAGWAVPANAWTREVIARRSVGGKTDRKSETGPMRQAAVWTELYAETTAQPDGSKGSVYLGTIGDPDDTDVDTLWWLDTTGHWHPTGLRGAVAAPVTVVTGDPDHPDEVWVGTTVGVWRGTRTLHGNDPPTWAWQSMVKGLPEASVEDLSVFNDSGIRLLRAAIAARGVWELQLDVAETTDKTYLRAHDDDLRYRSVSVALRRNGSERSWHGSPDVRPRVASAPLAPPASLPWRRGAFTNDTEGLRRFQAALRSHTGDRRVRATGQWDDYFNEVMRSLGAPRITVAGRPPDSFVILDHAFWDSHMVAPHSSADPWGAGSPTEEDLYELTPPLVEGTFDSTSCTLPASLCQVDVVVHHRGLDVRPGSQVQVTLLRWVDPRTDVSRARPANSTTWVPDPVPWTGPVNALLNDHTLPGSADLGGGWRFAESNFVKTAAPQELNGLRSGVVTFNLNLTGLAPDTVVLLVAVLRAGDADPGNDIALAAGPLRALVLGNAGVAARSINIGP